jgi:signal peptidase I
MAINLRKLFWKTWNFLVHEDTIYSFIADAILILIIGKFILFPGLGLIFGNEFPIVAVISGSMDHHNAELDDWWSENNKYYDNLNISKSDFNEFYLTSGFEKGDVLIIKSIPEDQLAIGDIIVYSVPYRNDPIIHRIVSLDPIGTKGDANQGQISFETAIHYNQIHGKAIFILPYIGWVKVGAMEVLGVI